MHLLNGQDYSINFDGNNDYVLISDHSELDLTENYTLEAWIFIETFDWLAGIISKYHSNAANGYTLRLTDQSPYTGLGFDELITGTGLLSSNQWYHIAAVNDGGERSLYINGVQSTLSGTALTVVSNNSPIRIGSDYASRYFDGRIDEVRIWNLPRDENDIVECMNSALTGQETGLVAYYTFNEGSGDILFDQTGNGHDGVLFGDPAWYENEDQSLIDFGSAQIIDSSVPSARDVFSGDLDGDGDTDVLSASAGDGTFGWYANDGIGNFGEKQTFHGGTYNHPNSVFTIDMDNDGDLDIVSSAMDNVSWHENNGDATSFNSYIISTSAGDTYAVYAYDLDEDGDIDVIVPSQGQGRVYWFENDGNQSFSSHLISESVDGAFSVFTMDLDNDGDQDVLSAGLGGQVAWHENDGDENFTSYVITSEAVGATCVHSSDVDGDGDMDVLSSSRGDDKIAWYENDGNQNFTTHIITSSAEVAYSVLSLDIDNDGDIDVISASQGDNKVAWHENDGNENFTTQVITTSADLSWAVHADDIDGDGDMDVLSAARGGDGVIAWHENFLTSLLIEHDYLPKKPELYPAYPNPFNPITTLRYDIPEDASVNITIYDIVGRQIKTLLNSPQTAGHWSIQWNSTNNTGQPVSAGLYLYTIQAGEFRQTKKMVLLK